MDTLAYVLVGIAWALFFGDAALTLHGLRSGKVVEKNRLMRWFVKSPWRIYPFTAVVCGAFYFMVRFALVGVGWPLAFALTIPIVVQRIVVVRSNYLLNIRILGAL